MSCKNCLARAVEKVKSCSSCARRRERIRKAAQETKQAASELKRWILRAGQ